MVRVGSKQRFPPVNLLASLCELFSKTSPGGQPGFGDAWPRVQQPGATDDVHLPRSSKSQIQNNPLVEQVVAASSQGLCVGA